MDEGYYSDSFPKLVRSFVDPPSISQVLEHNLEVSAADALYRDASQFQAGCLPLCKSYWDKVILPNHPQRDELSDWLDGGVRIERFLKRTVEVGYFLGQAYVRGGFPQRRHFTNYVSDEWIPWVTQEVMSLLRKGAVVQWSEEEFGTSSPEVVSPLLVEEAKPRLCADKSYVNLFCMDKKFSLDGAAKIPVVGWKGMFQFSLDHKSGYHHVPLHRSS